eukprot:gene14069-32468_t
MLLTQDNTNATGAIGFGTSPKQPLQNHTIFELAFAAMQGKMGVQLHDPGPRFACSVLETEIVSFVGTVKSSGGGSVETVDAAEFTRRSLFIPTTTTKSTPAVTNPSSSSTRLSTAVTKTSSITTLTTAETTIAATTSTPAKGELSSTTTTATATAAAAATTNDASSIKNLFDGLNEAITPAFRENYEPCLETSCQVETLSCFGDAACVAKLHIMASGTTKGAGGRSRRDPFMGGGFMFDDDFFEGNDDFLRPGSYFTMCNRGMACSVLPVDWADTKVVNGETFCCSAGTATITSKNILGFAMD